MAPELALALGFLAGVITTLALARPRRLTDSEASRLTTLVHDVAAVTTKRVLCETRAERPTMQIKPPPFDERPTRCLDVEEARRVVTEDDQEDG